MENHQTSTDQKLKGFFNSSSCEYIFWFVVPFKWTTLCYITHSCVNYSPMIYSTWSGCRRQWIQNFQCDLGVKSITISLSVRLCNLWQLLNNGKILKNWEIPLSCLFRIRWRKREELERQAVGQNTTGMEKVWTSAQFTTTDHHWSLRKQREAWWCRGYLKMFTHACTLGLRKFQKRVQVYFLAYG